MGNHTKSKASGIAALEVKVRLSVEVLLGSAAVAMTFFMSKCLENCSNLMEAMTRLH
jgi:hypothetical protein